MKPSPEWIQSQAQVGPRKTVVNLDDISNGTKVASDERADHLLGVPSPGGCRGLDRKPKRRSPIPLKKK